MAVTTRRAKAAQPAPGGAGDMAARAAGLEDLAEVTRILARITAGLVAHVSGMHARTPATFRQIVTQELRLGSDADVDAVEKFLRG